MPCFETREVLFLFPVHSGVVEKHGKKEHRILLPDVQGVK
jgi:hypothetical protein